MKASRAAEVGTDVRTILGRRHDNGDDFWATPDGRVYVGNPYSTITCLLMLHELELDAGHEAVRGGIDLLLDACRPDGRIRLGPKSPLYPCYTAEAARVLCRYGLAEEERVQRTVAYFLDSAEQDGGWRCNFRRFGEGPETEAANPGATLYVLDALRFRREQVDAPEATGAVDFLLSHWVTRAPLGPCHWGIGTQFLRVEFPFLRYNLFYWVYVLSWYPRARGDGRFLEALAELTVHLDDEGKLVIDHRHRGLKDLAFCAPKQPSEVATRRFREIAERMESTR